MRRYQFLSFLPLCFWVCSQALVRRTFRCRPERFSVARSTSRIFPRSQPKWVIPYFVMPVWCRNSGVPHSHAAPTWQDARRSEQRQCQPRFRSR